MIIERLVVSIWHRQVMRHFVNVDEPYQQIIHLEESGHVFAENAVDSFDDHVDSAEKVNKEHAKATRPS